MSVVGASARSRGGVSLPPESSSVALARRFVAGRLVSWGRPELVDTAVLLTSELVTNAIVHAGTEVSVDCALTGAGLEVEVRDRYPARTMPMQPLLAPLDAEGGRGLGLATSLASTWGVEYTPTYKRVWFRLDPAGTAATGGTAGAADPADPPGSSGHTTLPAPRADAEQRANPPGVTVVRPVGAGQDHARGAERQARAGGRPSPPGRAGVEPLLQDLTEWARDALDGDAAFAMLATDEDDGLELRAATGLPLRREDGTSSGAPDPGQQHPGQPDVPGDDLWAEPARLPMVLDDHAAARVDVLRGSGMRAMVAVPLAVEDRVVGSLAVASRQEGRFTAADARRLQEQADETAILVEGARLSELERGRRGVLGFLAEASDLLAGSLDPEMTMAMVAQLVVPRLARWCAVHTVDESGRSHLAYVWHEDERHLDPLRSALGDSPPAADATTLTLPLNARGRTIGMLTLGRAPGAAYRGGTVTLAEDLARRAALALDNARLYADRTEASRALQRSLLTPRLPAVPGCEVGVAYAAAGGGNEVGGDFYDLFPIADGRWGFAVGDVCGTGPEAAAVTGLARHALRLLARRGDRLAAALSELNAAVLEEAGGERFITLLSGELRPLPGGGAGLSMACAGHPLPWRVAVDGSVGTVGTSQPLLGVLEAPEFVTEEDVLAPGETFVAVTDGVLERRRGDEMFGEAGLVDVLRRARGLPAPAVAARVEQAVLDYDPSAPRDDMAVLVLRADATPR